MAKARVQKTNGSYRFNNYVQRDMKFSDDQVDALMALLKDLRKSGVPADPRSMKDASAYLELSDIEVYGSSREHNSIAWFKNTRTGEKMFIRNSHDAKTLIKELDPYSSPEHDQPDPYATDDEVSA
jgi:hypothetical protein